jgi:hypothetical protein
MDNPSRSLSGQLTHPKRSTPQTAVEQDESTRFNPDCPTIPVRVSSQCPFIFDFVHLQSTPTLPGAEEADEEPLAVAAERDLSWPAARPAEHLAERELPLLCGLDALLRGHLPHPLDPLWVDPQAGHAWDRLTGAERRWLLCCFPH